MGGWLEIWRVVVEVGVKLGNERMNGSLHSMDVCGLVCMHV